MLVSFTCTQAQHTQRNINDADVDAETMRLLCCVLFRMYLLLYYKIGKICVCAFGCECVMVGAFSSRANSADSCARTCALLKQ